MKYKCTVFIPTYNGGKYIQEILKAVVKQEYDQPFEVLVIDSGSIDGTITIVKKFCAKYPNVRLHTIPNKEFGHGKTRQLAADMAKGEYIVYLSHDATPRHKRWLYEITKPLSMDERIVAVMGKQHPRPHCPPIIKREINKVFGSFGPDFGTTLFYKDDFIKDRGTNDAVRFYSDVNSATRTAFLRNVIPYRDVPYAEDMMFGQDIIDAGMIKAYAPRGDVIHSNDLTLRQYAKRMFDETYGLRKIGAPVEQPALRHVVKMVVRGVIRDSYLTLHDDKYSAGRKLYWLFVNPLFHIEKWRGVRRACRKNVDHTVVKKYSLERGGR